MSPIPSRPPDAIFEVLFFALPGRIEQCDPFRLGATFEHEGGE